MTVSGSRFGLPVMAQQWGTQRSALRFGAVPGTILAGPARDTVRFGQKTYLEQYQKVHLTPEQKVVAQTIVAISQTRDVRRRDALLNVLNEPDYRSLVRIRGRQPFHSPIADWLLSLSSLHEQNQLIDGLTTLAGDRRRPLAQRNAMESLADLYFYALRPGGALAEQAAGLSPQAAAWRKKNAEKLKGRLLQELDRLSDPERSDLRTATLMRDTLSLHWANWLGHQTWQSRSDHLKDAGTQGIQREILPLVNRPLPALPPRKPRPASLVAALNRALLDPDPAALRKLHANGVLAFLIPEWRRVAGPGNTQHSTQDFTLLEHTLNAVAHTKQSPWYLSLPEHSRRLVAMAALLHDIGKFTGPANLAPLIPPDKAHPVRSEMIARRALPALGYSPEEIEAVARLVLHHQLLGNLVTYSPGVPDPVDLHQAAMLVEDARTLQMLKALTEGDIRSVKKDSAWFTDEVACKLGEYGNRVLGALRAQAKLRVPLLQSDISAYVHDEWEMGTPVRRLTLEEALAVMADGRTWSAYAVKEGVTIIRVQAEEGQRWLTMPFEDFQKAPHRDTQFDRLLYAVQYGDSWELMSGRTPYGLMVDVHYRDVAARTWEDRIRRLPSSLLKEPAVFRQVLSGIIEDPYASLLRQMRENPVHDGNMLIAARPRPRAAFYVQDRAGEPIRLPPDFLRFIKTHRLPLVIL